MAHSPTQGPVELGLLGVIQCQNMAYQEPYRQKEDAHSGVCEFERQDR
jgi:hypothetical protein